MSRLKEIDREIRALFKERKGILKARQESRGLHPDLFRGISIEEKGTPPPWKIR